RSEWDCDGRTQVLRIPTVHVPRVVRTLLEEGWHVEADEGPYRQPGAIDVAVSSGIDWFDLNGAVDYGGVTASLPRLLAALQRGDSHITLDDGSLGLLPEEGLPKPRIIARLRARGGGRPA